MLALVASGKGEERPAGAVEVGLQRRVDAVADDVEEPDVAAGGVELRRDRSAGVDPFAPDQGPDVDDREIGHGATASRR